MTAWELFGASLAIGAGVAISIAVYFAVAWLFDNGFRLLENFAAAAQRYAVRDEVVTDYYDRESMETVRWFESPTPSRVTVAKRKVRK